MLRARHRRQPLTDQPDPDPPWLEPLARGDWATFWPRFITLPRSEQQWFEERNDPRAMAAAFQGARLSRRNVELDGVRAPVLAYCGSLDDPRSMQPTAAALGVELSLIDGCDHLDAFRRAELVTPLDIEHLDRHAPSRNH